MPTTEYIWDVVTDNVMMEKDGAGNTQAVYTQDPFQYGRLISQRRGGSTRALTDENQNVTDTYTYTAFGETVAQTGTTKNPYRYGGQHGYQYNEETDDYYVREVAVHSVKLALREIAGLVITRAWTLSRSGTMFAKGGSAPTGWSM